MGNQHLEACILVNPEQQDAAVAQLLLDRLIHHGKAYEAKHLILRGPDTQNPLHHNVQHFGFVAAQEHEYSLSVASETGA